MSVYLPNTCKYIFVSDLLDTPCIQCTSVCLHECIQDESFQLIPSYLSQHSGEYNAI